MTTITQVRHVLFAELAIPFFVFAWEDVSEQEFVTLVMALNFPSAATTLCAQAQLYLGEVGVDQL